MPGRSSDEGPDPSKRLAKLYVICDWVILGRRLLSSSIRDSSLQILRVEDYLSDEVEEVLTIRQTEIDRMSFFLKLETRLAALPAGGRYGGSGSVGFRGHHRNYAVLAALEANGTGSATTPTLAGVRLKYSCACSRVTLASL